MTNLFDKRKQYYFIASLRFLVPLLIFKYPVLTIVAATILDSLDCEFASRGVLTKTQYQIMDKISDLWWYLVLMIYSLVYFQQFLSLFLILFVYRIIGSVIWFLTRRREVFLVFPNFFENAFFLFFFATYFKDLNFLLIGKNLYYSLFIVFALKLIQEYIIHVAKYSVREDLFKWKRHWAKE